MLGLCRPDIINEDGVWAFEFAFTEVRRLKNLQSKRKVLIHKYLTELGFLKHIAEVDTGRIFPELKRKSARANFCDDIHYNFRAMFDKQLGPTGDYCRTLPSEDSRGCCCRLSVLA